MKLKNKLLTLIVPLVIALVVAIVLITHLISEKKITELQYELLKNRVAYIVERSQLDFHTIDQLGMSNVDFYRLATQSGIWKDLAANLDLGEAVFFIDARSGEIIHQSSKLSVEVSFSDYGLANLLSGSSLESRFFLNKEGDLINGFIASYDVFDQWNWIIVAVSERAKFLRYGKDATIASVMVAMLALFISIIVIYFIFQHFDSAIDTLIKGAERISKNIFDENIDVKGIAELSYLAKRFNDMAARINESQQKLKKSILEQRRINSELKNSQQQKELALQGGDLGAWVIMLENKEISIDARLSEMLGLTSEEAPQSFDDVVSLIHPDDVDAVLNNFEGFLNENQAQYEAEFRMRHSAGRWVWILSRGRVVEWDKNATATRISGTHMDITERKKAEENLTLAASVFKYAHEGIYITDLKGNIVDVNNSLSELSGYPREEIVGKHEKIICGNQFNYQKYREIKNQLHLNQYWFGERAYCRKNGELYTVAQATSAVKDSSGKVTHYVSLFTDITSNKEHQAQLEHMAHFDLLTGLPNRGQLGSFLSHAMASVLRNKTVLCLVYLDLDGFKKINDSYGHQLGDKFLLQLAKCMQCAMRKVDLLARVGGDEFVAVFTGLHSDDEFEPLIKRLLNTIVTQITIDGISFSVSASLGVSFFEHHMNLDSGHLVRQADQAMYQAKILGGNCFQIYDSKLEFYNRSRNEKLDRISQAIREHEFVLYYQPKLNLRSGEIVGVEALIRWKHPEQGILLPSTFLPSIEDHAHSIQLGEWVIEEALRQGAAWCDLGLDLSIGVNISALHLQQVDFAVRLEAATKQYPKFPSSRLEIEILETSALKDFELAKRVITQCKGFGVEFALDDFGTGYSSLAYLRQLDVKTIKIDQSFVCTMENNLSDRMIVAGVIGLAKAFKCEIIAEGVENVKLGNMLLDMGCELAQGHGIARPMPAENIPSWCGAARAEGNWLAGELKETS